MENNHGIMADSYKIRRTFFDSSIKILCNSIKISELDDKMTSGNAMIKLCELTESGECSKLQKALDILMKYGDNLIITDMNGTKHSNADNLGITNDDIKLLHLLTRTYVWNNTNFSEFFKNSIYGSIYIKTKNNEKSLFYSICNLYGAVFDMHTTISIEDTESYKTYNINKIKKHLNQLQNKKIIDIHNNILESDIFNNIIKNGLTIDKFKNGVIQKYLEAAEYNISIINGTAVPFKHKFKRVLSIILIIFIIILIIIMSIIEIFPTETKEIMNNLFLN
ncbi:hypothetical protein NEPAR06_0398 [Nematocida parisii]|uniref:Uncharacterized protein n=1 Tax=Nematocida parisii (strain ERTm3) TaxID=935791 RepID=I3EIH1_NEMP3|nr:hypothetical protein NEQG_00837 [Nematocida parisii ERTm3]KAI5144617.1 hypothetical protein NEPAR07_1195 [Nematocida parisii]KAI5153390.1 hypothetical protein NEPAR06_0398 [Nematocida parisii]KAI5156177.1 hypothetical protein NEPAR05_0354 [Nematocida parisii]